MTAAATPSWLPPTAWALAGVLSTLGRTWRIERSEATRRLDAELLAGRRCIYALWHARLFPLVYTHRGRGVAVLISRHRDGEWFARATKALGYRPVRG